MVTSWTKSSPALHQENEGLGAGQAKDWVGGREGGGAWQQGCGMVEVLTSHLNSSGHSSVPPIRSVNLTVAGPWATRIAGRARIKDSCNTCHNKQARHANAPQTAEQALSRPASQPCRSIFQLTCLKRWKQTTSLERNITLAITQWCRQWQSWTDYVVPERHANPPLPLSPLWPLGPRPYWLRPQGS